VAALKSYLVDLQNLEKYLTRRFMKMISLPPSFQAESVTGLLEGE
jgi:hypothetical protein